MARVAKEKTAPSPALDAGQRQVLVNAAEFVRTRDALVTSWTRLEGALHGAIQAYIEHSNTALGGGEALTHDRLNLLTNLTGGIVPSIEVKNEENVSGKKTGAKRGPKPKPKLKPEDEDEEPEDTNDPNRPKKAITAYIRYCQDQRAIIAERLGANAPTGKVGETLTEAWNTLPEEEKQVYRDAYNRDRVIADARIVEYKVLKAEEKRLKKLAKGGEGPAGGVVVAEAEAEVDEELHDAEPGAGAGVTASTSNVNANLGLDVSEDDTDDGSDNDDLDDSDDEPEKEPTPPPVKTPKGGKGKAKVATTGAPSSTPAGSSSTKKSKGNVFTSVNAAKDASPGLKRKSEPTKTAAAEEPKAKKTKKAAAPAPAPAAAEPKVVAESSPAKPETNKAELASAKKEKKPKKARKSAGFE